jgi:diguanylate cyclase (GGDEF)-like protein
MALPLAENACVVVVLSLAYGGLASAGRRWPADARQAAGGLLFGLAAVIAMLAPVPWSEGIFFDTRAVPVALAATFAGPFASAIAALPPIVDRLSLGGSGAFAGVVGLIAAATLGTLVALLLRRLSGDAGAAPGWRAVIPIALLLPPTVLSSLMLIADVAARNAAFAAVGLPISLILPAATVILGGALLIDRERRAAALRLAEHERAVSSMLANVPGVFFRRRRNANGWATYPVVSGRVQAVLGIGAEAAVADPRGLFIGLHPDDRVRLRTAFDESLRPGAPPVAIDVRLVLAGCIERWLHITGRPVPGTENSATPEWDGFAADVTERKLAELALAETRSELSAAVERDPLTGLLNRRGLDKRLTAEWRRMARENRPLSVVTFDVDRFKAFNDAAGHAAGDACLRAVADALRTAVRRPADEVARVGGEEFVLLLPGTSIAGAMAVAEFARATLAESACPHPTGGLVTISAGVATVRPDASEDEAASVAALLAEADAALYDAKHAGRDRVATRQRTAPLAAAA